MFLYSFNSLTQPILAGPATTNYELREYGFGSGGTVNSSTANYSLFGISGETGGGEGSTANYKSLDGLTFTMQANVPPAPTFSNPATNYDRLKFIINAGGNPTDAVFAIAISSDNFVTTRYIQDNNTVGTALGSEDWQTYTNWGGASGEFVSSLAANTTYKIKVKAKHGNFTESGWGPEATIATVDPSLSFSVSSNSVTFDNLNSGNSYTDSAKSTILTTSTNAYNGYTVYAHETQSLTSGVNTISDYASSNATPSTWTGTGFGYTTSDSNLAGGTSNRFTNGGAKYAGFTTSAPGDPVADHVGPIETAAVSNEAFTVSYRVTASASTQAGSYTSKIIYVVVPIY